MPYDEATSPESDTPPSVAERPEIRPAEREPREREQPKRRDEAPPPREARNEGAEKSKARDEEKGRRRSPLVWIILLIVLIAAAIGGVIWWQSVKNLESTDDAYTDGRATAIAPKTSGTVIELLVNDNQFVRRGQLLLRIDPRDLITARDQAKARLNIALAQQHAAELAAEVARKNFPARLAQAQAQLAQANASLFNAQTEYNRQHRVARAATTQQAIDQSAAQLQQAQAQVQVAQAQVQEAEPVQPNIGQAEQQVGQLQAQVDEARAQLAQAELNLSYAEVHAPQDGWVTKRNVEVGNYVTTGTTLMMLVSPQVWVTGNFKETQLDRMRPGQKVDIRVDAYPGLKLEGHVDSVQLGSGSKFSAFPAENATGNYVKIVQRVPVKIDIDNGLDPNLPLPLGISVEPTVHLK